ncbi:MAG: ADP-forming succinate--CoA ligase subunit beta [Planctomycetota bacterium]
MKLHEYQAKQQFRAAGLAVPEGRVVTTPRGAAKAYRELGGALAVVKAQIHAGGRGKGGGVRLVRSAKEAQAAARDILGRPLVTHQTGSDGVVVRTLLVEEGLDIARQIYAAVVLDRRLETPVLMASAEGGVEIEEVAAKKPHAILREPVDPFAGLDGFRARRLAYRLKVPKELVRPLAAVLQGLAYIWLTSDASLVEVNPLVTTTDGRVVCLDGKMSLDDSALFRHRDLAALRDEGEEEPTELRAREAGLSYVKLDGNIGCLVNGAGLAMATMDIVKLHGGEPANFLDVGGSATAEQVTTAFRIILEDPAVKGILVNIFGGIMRCDVLANGVVEATKAVGLDRPLVVRLEGTKVEEGRRILGRSGLDITAASDMADAAAKIVEAVS